MLGERQAQARECIHALRLRERHADDLGRARHAQHHGGGRGHVGLLVVDRAAAGVGRAADLQHKFGDALDVLHRQFGVDAALEAVAGVGREIEAARTPGNGVGPPERGLDEDVPGVVADGGGVAAHDARERFESARVGDHAYFFIDGDGVAVEQLERLARAAPAHGEVALDLVQVEDVRRPAQLEHHVVGDVHQRRDAALAAARQALDHPLRRAGTGIDVSHDAPGKAPAQVGGLDVHGQTLVGGRGGLWKLRGLERRAGERGQLACDAVDAERMPEVGRELEREQRVVQVQMLTDVLADGRVGRQFQQPAVIVGELELARRAQHAVAFHAAQLADLDVKRLAVLARRQLGADERAGHADARAGVGRAADDGEQLRTARIDLAHAQAVGIRVGLGLLDFAHDDAGERRRGRPGLFHLQARHGERVGQLPRAQGRIAEFAQPGFRKLHVRFLGVLLNEELLALYG